MAGDAARLGPLESATMEVLWAAEQPMSVRELRTALSDRGPAYTTVSTVLENLRRKGWVDREQLGRVWFYRPRTTRVAHAAHVMSEALRESTNPQATLLRFVGEMSEEDAETLRHLIADVPR